MRQFGGAHCAVLLSGGVDSAVVLASLKETSWRLACIWVDYGQRPRESERAASQRIASHYEVPWSTLIAPTLDITPGEIAHRNDLLVSSAAASKPGWSIGIGIHAGTGYADCSHEWLAAWRRLMQVQDLGGATIVAPLAQLEKREVYALAQELKLPISATHSCEVSNTACGSCSSCHDRGILNVGA